MQEPPSGNESTESALIQNGALAARLVMGQKRAMEALLRGARLNEVLDILARCAEDHASNNLFASILLLSNDGTQLLHGAAPRIPPSYNERIHGIAIGPAVGSCGTAAYSRTEVVVADIANDFRWQPFKELALAHNLRACWSTPILSSSGKVLGTFALYYQQPGEPSGSDREVIAILSQTAAIIIESHRNASSKSTTEKQLAESNERFELVNKATQDAIWDWNLLTNDIWWSSAFTELFGYSTEEIEPDISSWSNRVHPDDRDRVVGGIHEVIDHGGKNWSAEYRFRRKDGSYAIVFDRGYALHNAEGKAYRMLGSMQDITKRHEAIEQTRRSEQRFQAAVAAVQGVLWTNDAEGKMKGEQPGWSNLTGQSFDEYQDYGWATVVHPEDSAPTVEAWKLAVDQRRPFIFEHRLRVRSGEYRLFSIRAVPVLDDEKSIREWVGVHTDITEQRQAEDRIRESEQRFHNLIRNSSVGIIVLQGKDLVVSVVNDAYGRLIDRTTDELLNKPLFDIIPEAEDPFRPLLEDVMKTGKPMYLYDQPYSVQSKGKTITGYLNLIYQPYRELDGHITGVMALCQDITAQVNARSKAELAEETANMAVASAGLGTFNVDLKNNRLISSSRLDEIFEVDEETDRERFVQALHPDDLAIRSEAYERAKDNGLLEYEARILRKDGSVRWIRAKGRIFFDADRQPKNLVGVVQDITEEKLFNEELARQVKERTQEIEQFTYVSHHDLQEPLRKILIFADMVRQEADGKLSEGTLARLNNVINSANRMSGALRDVLNYASLSKEEPRVKVALNDVLREVLNDLELSINDKEAVVQIGELPRITGVPHQLQRLFYNLLSNAIKFSDASRRPHITVTSGPPIHVDGFETQICEIRVRDNGIGFEQEFADRIFGLFQRLHSRGEYPGTGIGLAICRKVVLNHGGTIRAFSEPGKGTEFLIRLPV